MPPVNLANVNVSLQQFQSISSGKYNAGEVKLASETTLGKVNNHVHRTGANATPLSHEEVLANKNAFVKALSSIGVGDAEIAKIRRDLGLSADAGIDRALHERSLKPLTRQQVRDILDRNAAAINTHAGNNRNARIRMSAQIYGAGGMNAERADRRNAVNASLAGARGTKEHEGIALAEAAISGDVDFRSFEESKDILAQARAQLNALLERSKGQPSAAREAVVEFRIRESGLPIRIATGMTELAFARRLEETIFRLVAYKADERSIDVRTAAVIEVPATALDPEEKRRPSASVETAARSPGPSAWSRTPPAASRSGSRRRSGRPTWWLTATSSRSAREARSAAATR